MVRTLSRTVAAALALSALAAPAAHGGTYDVYSCTDPVTGKSLGPTYPSGWTTLDSNPGEANYVTTASCNTDGGSVTLTPWNANDGGSITASESNPRYAQLQFQAPAGLGIRGYELWRSMHVSGSRNMVVTRAHDGENAERCNAAVSSCHIGDAYAPFAAINRVSHTFSGAAGSYVALQLLCYGAGCTKSSDTALVRLFSARVTLEETDRPSFTSPPAGTLLAAGEVSGLRSLDFVASDVGSGVREVTVSSSAAPGAPLVSKITDAGNGWCSAAKFTRVVPCPASVDDSVEVDTRQFPDGEQTITIAIADAAANTRSVTRTIDVHNAPASTGQPSVGGFEGPIAAGDTLTCDPGRFDPEPDTITYAWLVDGAVVPGQGNATYVVRSQDVGRSIICRVTATVGGGSTTVDSAPVGGSGQPGGPAPVDSCAGQPTGPRDPCGDYDGDGIPNQSDPDDDNDGVPDVSDPNPFDATVVAMPGGAGGAGGAGGPGGSGGSGAGAGSGSGSGTPVNVFLGTPNNGAHASNSARFTLSGVRRKTLPFGRRTRVTVTLRDESGRPISGAQVAVLKRMSVPGAGFVAARAPMTTDAAGRISWLVPASYSRTLRFAYKANLGNTEFQSTTDIVLRVRSKTTLRRSAAFLRNGQTLRFTGRLLSRPVPKGGVLIDLQARVGSRWQTFRTTRTRRSGRWSSKYTFRSTHGLQTYRFRARVRQDTGYPYALSTSKTIQVRVSG